MNRPGQCTLSPKNDYVDIDNYLLSKRARRILLVQGDSAERLEIGKYFLSIPFRLGIKVYPFTKFHPNPSYDSVVDGVKEFHAQCCDMIVALGGGSAIDVAKCIKLYENLDPSQNYLCQEILPNRVPFLAIPTTAGTGSETTRYAVIYFEGEKQSITHESCIPEAICLDPSTLKTLPTYHRASSMLDAFCHALEAWWSVNSTEESRRFSKGAIKLILEYRHDYMNGNQNVAEYMMQAAHLAGKAINITQTTAGHAMCYKLTSLYGLAHGHAAALCDAVLWPYMATHLDDCRDARGRGWLEGIFQEISEAMGSVPLQEAMEILPYWLGEMGMEFHGGNAGDIAKLASAVNLVRLRNNPVRMDIKIFGELYGKILSIGM